MVTTLEDVQLLVALRNEVAAGLDAEGIARSHRIITGIMIEVPGAALIAGALAPLVEVLEDLLEHHGPFELDVREEGRGKEIAEDAQNVAELAWMELHLIERIVPAGFSAQHSAALFDGAVEREGRRKARRAAK